MESRGRAVPGGTATSPESAMASELFDHFVSAGTFKSVLSTYRQICEVLRLKPTNVINFYPRLKAKLHSWRAASLWAKLDKRASHKCYNRGKACPNTRVLIIGAGPCGLRAAIEAQLLGAKVVVLEKRDRFSRNNVLHLWPFVIHDLRNLGAKKFFGKFCAGSIDHISIRQLQIILLKVALLLGVEVHENVGFECLIEPQEDQTFERVGWHARISPLDHPVSQYEFDVLIGADGKRNTLLGFNRKEFRGKLAIAVTANFINRHTIEEARVPEISGVAFIFNQKFFQDMREQTAIDLENIVYYKDDTHYFVMTAKKQSLLERGVIIRDYNDTARLLAPENVDREALMEYARDAADFATNYQLPSLDFAVNHYGQADVAMFDFTSMYAAENACRVIEKKGYKLLQGLVGDSLLEPFWPTGSGCARGFLSSFDAAWMIRSWASGRLSTLQVLAEREAIYRLLAQTTPENLSKDLNQYTLNPSSRYPNLNLQAVLPSQVRSLYDTDGKIEENILDVAVEAPKKKKRRESMIHPDTLLHWCQKQVALHDKIKIQDFTSSWKSGLALCAILHRYRPDLIDLPALDPENIAKNNQLAFDICERELGIPPIMTGQEMAECAVPDKLTMVSYISQVYESFRGEIPVVCYPNSHSGEERTSSPNRQLHSTPLSILNRIGTKLQSKRKYSIEKESKERERGENVKRRTSLLTHKRRSKERALPLDKLNQDVILTDYKSVPVNKPRESINTRVKHLEEKMMRDAGLRCHLSDETESSKAARIRSEQTELNIKLLQEQLKKNGNETNFKSKMPKVGKLRKDEWNVKIIEEKTKQQQNFHLKTHSHTEKPKIYRDIFASKLQQMDEKIKAGGTLTPEEEARYKRFDASLNKLKNRLSKGNLEVGEKGQNQTAAMAEHMSSIWSKKAGGKKDPLPPAPVVNVTVETDSSTNTSGSETCYFCKKRVYLMERLSAEGLFFHRSCFKCEYCSASLRLGNYSFDRDAICGGKFYCAPHFRMQKPDHRWQEMMKRKQAFLSCALEEQEKEKLYKTLLDNTEKALSPGKQTDKVDSPSKDSTNEAEGKKEDREVTSLNLLAKPSSPFGRDQTPERVEYENSIIELSEEELLTSELEEEELTQKNLGPSQDLATSEDEYSDLSTDTESDEEAFAEELERSLTADETRKLAETWNRKYSAEHSLIQNVSSSSAADDEGSDTEIGSDDTSDDIDSDAEYSLENSEEDGASSNKDAEPENQDTNKTPDAKEFTMEVPVIDLKSINKLSEDDTSSESDISEELTDSEDDTEGETGTEVDSESEAKEPVPPPQIPTIIIHESPPQDTDLDQEWGVNVSASKTDNIENPLADESVIILSDTSEVNVCEQKIENPVDELAADLEHPGATTSADHDIDQCGKTMDGKFTSFHDKDKGIDNISFMKEIKISTMVNESLENKVNSVAPLATEESSSDLSLSSGINSLAKEIVSDVLKAAKDSIFEYQTNSVDSRTKVESAKISSSSNSSQYSEKSSSSSESANWVVLSSSSEEAKIQLIDLCSPDQPNVKISSSISKLPDEDNVEVVDLCSPSSPDFKQDRKQINISSKASKMGSNIILQEESSSSYLLSKEKNLFPAELPLYDACSNSENFHLDTLHINTKDSMTSDERMEVEADVEDILLEDTVGYGKVSMSDEFLNNSCDQNFISPFITLRKKKINKSGSDTFNWDSDNSISLPWCAEDISNEEIIDLSKDGIYHADVAQTVDAELVKEKQMSRSEKDATNIFDKGSLNFEFSDGAKIASSVLSKSLPTPSVCMPHEISESLLHTSASDSDKLASSVPKNTMPCELSINSSVECKESTPSSQITSDLVHIEKNLNSITVDCTSLSNLSNSGIVNSAGMKQETCDRINSKSDSKYKGYSGSFAEKVRPKSLFCDSIYLRSLDIKLQKQPFSSLNKSDDKLDECSQVNFDSGLRRKLFVESDDSMNENSKEYLASTTENNQCSSAISSCAIQKSACIKSSNVPDEATDKFISTSLSKAKTPSHKHTSVSFSAPESYSDLVSPYTCVQTKTSDESSFPTKMRPKCDIDINKLRQKREKRKSVHEDIQGLPFADEEKLVSPIEPPGSPDVFTTPKSTLEKNSKESMHSSGFDASGSSTYKTPNLIDEERYVRLQSTVDQEKARLEARARARLKSDEELGLSPNNYRKKYKRQLSLNSINYDELCSDEFCDQDDELEDDIISNFCQTKSFGIEQTFSMFKNTDLYVKGKTPEKSLTSSHPFEPQQEEKFHKPDLPPLNIAKGESVSVGSLDDNEHESETYINKSMPLLQISKHSSKTSSSETSPDIFCSETPPLDTKFSSKVRSKGGKAESSGDDDKSKSNGKKSIFSILNFGKGNVSKEKLKQKVKDPEKDLLSSLPNDFGSKVLPKSKPFSHLKLNKSKEKTTKLKAKSVPPEDNATTPSENIPTQEDSVHVSFNSSQAKIIPKYTVYRNPETMISTFPVHLPVPKMENGLAPKASEDSFSDEDDTQGSKVGRIPNAEKCDKNANEKEKKTQRIVQKVQRQQVLKRLRNAQEIQRRLEELEIQQKELEHQGVELEKLLRGERHGVGASKGEAELMQEWYTLVHSKNKLMREEQELTIRLKDLELEDRHSKLQQDMRERMSRSDSLKTAAQIMEERKILAEMLEIVEKRDELVAMLEQLRLREVEEERNLSSDAITKGLKSPLSPEEKS